MHLRELVRAGLLRAVMGRSHQVTLCVFRRWCSDSALLVAASAKGGLYYHQRQKQKEARVAEREQCRCTSCVWHSHVAGHALARYGLMQGLRVAVLPRQSVEIIGGSSCKVCERVLWESLAVPGLSGDVFKSHRSSAPPPSARAPPPHQLYAGWLRAAAQRARAREFSPPSRRPSLLVVACNTRAVHRLNPCGRGCTLT